MANYTAADVKRLREETDAPMMECKTALEEGGGDFDKAKQILREKGKAAAAKRADRTTSEGVVAISAADDGKTVGAVVVESETDFVARNADFIAMCTTMADSVRDGKADDASLKAMAEDAVAKIRENIQVTKSVRLSGPDNVVFYVHHDRKSGAIVTYTGDADAEVARKVAVHATAGQPQVVHKGELSQDMLDKEYEIQLTRALNDGKPQNIAENIAKGRVNKEFIKEVVLLEQPFYLDNSKTVGQHLSENAKGVTITGLILLAVGGK